MHPGPGRDDREHGGRRRRTSDRSPPAPPAPSPRRSLTWFVAVGIIESLADNVSALNLQAATGLLAIVVLLVVMNWFFHKVYWTGWISMHSRQEAGS